MLFLPEGWTTQRSYSAGWFSAIVGVLLWPLTRFARLTGYELALRLARGLAEYILRKTELYRPDGRFYDLIQGHFYARTTTAGGLLHLGILTGKQEYVQLAELVYKHAKEWGTSFGWFPEDLSRPGCETCCIKDLIELGIGLAMHVDAKYWEDVERFGRNHLLESQVTSIDWVPLYRPAVQLPPPPEDPLRITRDHVMERGVGGFAGWSGVNDWVSSRPQMMSCCHASGARALYDLWHYGVTKTDDSVSIGMLFSRATNDVIVSSYLPFEGRVAIKCKGERNVRVRVPGHASSRSLRLELNGQTTPARPDQGWLKLPRTGPGDAVVLRFDLPEHNEGAHLGYSTYEVTYRGNTVIAISPRGKVYPLYERSWAKSAPPALAPPVPPKSPEIDSI